MKLSLRKELSVICFSAFLPGHLFAMPVSPGSHVIDSVPTTCSTPVTIWLEDFTLPDGTTGCSGTTAWSTVNTSPSRNSVFAVDSNEFRVNDITINGWGTWTSGSIDISGKINVSISVDVRSQGGLSNDLSAHADSLLLYYKLDGGAEVLFAGKLGKINNNKTIDTTLSVGSLSGSSLQIIIKGKATATSEYYFFDNVKVTGTIQSSVDASAKASTALTCASPSVTLSGSSTASNVSYQWTGPNGFTSAVQNPTVSMVGAYTLTVTNPAGCAATSTATVAQNIAAPSSVTAIVSSKLSCSQTSVTLAANSTTTGATYTWTGPGSFTSSARVATVALGGTYTLVATNPADGCTITKTVAVVADTATPANLVATNDGPLTCSVFSVTLTGSSSTAGTTYQWTGPNGFFDITQVTTGTDSGTYTLIATNPANGCIGTTTTTVTADFSACGSAVARHLVTAQSTSIDPTGGATGNTDPATQFEYKVYPNPVSTTAFITLRSPQTAMASVEIYNTLGVREAVLFNNTVEANQSYQFTVDAGHFNAGVHYCMIRVNNKVYTTKLLFTSGRH